MNSTSVDIKDWLEANSGLGLEFADNLFIGREPTAPDNCVTIYDTPGEPARPDFEGDSNIFTESIQVRVRNKSYIVGWTLAEDIRDVLHPVSNTKINETIYLSIFHQNGPFVLEWDSNSRVIIILNFQITRKE